MIGGAVGGVFIGLCAIEAFALVGPGIASITMFTSPDNSMNLIYALIAIPVSFFTAFGAVLLLWHEDSAKTEAPAHQEGVETNAQPRAASPQIANCFESPVVGQMIALEEVSDTVFASKLVGDGIAVIPSEGTLYAPVSGEIISIYETGHALSMMADNGAELLFHIGIDTVQLEGDYFTALVKAGDRVNVGDELIHFDLDNIIAAGYDPTVMAVIANYEDFQIEPVAEQKAQVQRHQTIFMLEELA